MINDNLIFDLGLHNGDDTDFYLNKGFKVVAVEADPDLIEKSKGRFKDYVDSEQLVLVNKAVTNHNNEICFYVHPDKSDWSSCFKSMAESDGTLAKKVIVQGTTFENLCNEFGTPRYAKVDIEGCDELVAKELCKLIEPPKFISFETSKTTYASIISWLYTSGYNSFQLINQALHPVRNIPTDLQKEGLPIDYTFSKYSSGYFGNDLDENKWLDLNEVLTRYVKYKELKIIDNVELGLGWLDIHARRI